MKKLVKILALSLVLVFSLSLVACGSSYAKLEKAFTNKGYTVNEKVENTMTAIKNQLEKEDLALEIHCLKGVYYPSGIEKSYNVYIFEFKNTEDLTEACEENASLKAFITGIQEDEDAQAFYNALVEKGYANGNCLVLVDLLVPSDIRTDVKEIVKNA